MNTVIFETKGDGYWSNLAKEVRITDMKVAYVNDEQDFGELRVFFDKEDWSTQHHGLIYTDSKFLSMLQAFLCEHGIEGNDVDYSEQGMQGGNFVSCDVGEKFLTSWNNKFGTNLKSFVSI